MQRSRGSITQLARLVESLAELLKLHYGADGLPAAQEGDLCSREVEGRPLGELLAELWPDSAPWRGPCLGREAIRDTERLLRFRLQRVREQNQALAARLERVQRQVAAQRRELETRLQAAGLEVEQAQARLEALSAELGGLRAELERRRERARRRRSYLEGVSPRGINRFVDAQGRILDQATLRRAARELRELQALVVRTKDACARLEHRWARARLELARARSQEAGLRAELARLEPYWQAKTRRLEHAFQILAARREELKPLERNLHRLRVIGLAHAEVVARGQGLLAPHLAPPAPRQVLDPVESLEESLAQAGGQARRGWRLTALMERLGRRLERRLEAIGPALKEQRRLNREINRLEEELPRLLEPLLAGDGADPRSRQEAGARFSLLIARLEDLIPQARAAQERLDTLRRELAIYLARGKTWQAAWRRAGKDERAALHQARALVEEVRLAARQTARQAEQMRRRAAPVVKALSPLRSQDLLPMLAELAQAVEQDRRRAQGLEARAAELEGRIPAPYFGNLSKPPLALKPVSAGLRRLSGKQVELERLAALERAARRWQGLVDGPLVEEIRRPVEQVALRLARSLTLLERQKNLLASRHQQQGRELSTLKAELDQRRQREELARRRLEQVRARNRRQQRTIRHYETELKETRAQAALARRLEDELARLGEQARNLARRLERSDKLAAALKRKSLERHRLYRRSQYAVEWLDYWRERALEQEKLLGSARAELELARREYQQARDLLASAVSERDQALKDLAAERAARARQALDLLGGKALSVELAASRSEAGRWAKLAQDMALALAASGEHHQRETAELRAQVDQLSAEAAMLKRQLERIAAMVEVQVPGLEELADLPPAPPRRQPVALRLVPLGPEQVAQALDRLAAARRRLQNLGRGTLGHWALIAALTCGLVLTPPGTPSKATRTDAPLKAPRPALRHLAQSNLLTPIYQVPAQARLLGDKVARGSLELNLLPLRGQPVAVPGAVKRRLKELARQAGLSPKVLLTSARALYTGQAAVDPDALEELAHTARQLARRHPLIFRELSRRGLPPAASAVAALAPEPEKAQHLFLDRLYREYRSLGFSAEEALGALAANQRAFQQLSRQWTPPRRFIGKVQPVEAVEKMDLRQFLEKITPYIQSKLKVFLRQRGMSYSGDLNLYAKNLAFDMYCAAKKFQVPVTLLLAIAHQETWYANVLGDANRSASPFQIYEPTRELIVKSMAEAGFVPPPKKIKLQRHLTMATFMASFHLRELMQRAYTPPRRGRQAVVNLDRVLQRYNGSSRYAAQVALRKRQLARFLRRQG